MATSGPPPNWDPEWGPYYAPGRHRFRRRVKRLLGLARAIGRSPADPARGVGILAYHGTGAGPERGWWIDFKGQMALIEDLGYRVVSLERAVDILRAGESVDRPTLVITFDDGWASNLDVAFPELARRRWPATVFIATSYLGRRPYLLGEEVARVPEFGITVGNHTHTHRDLPSLSADEIVEEIHECERRLADLDGKPIRHFCYPNGRYGPNARGAVAASGMESACAGRVGFNVAGQDIFLLRRLTVDPGEGPRELRARLAGGFDFLDRRQRHMDGC